MTKQKWSPAEHENRRRQTEARVTRRIEDVEDLLSWGIPLAEAAERAGFPSISAAGRYLYRHGRPDLGRPFSTLHEQARRRHRARQQVAA